MEVNEKCYDLNTQKFKCSSRGPLPFKLHRSIDIIAQKEGYLSHKIFNRLISSEGGNYFAILYEVDIKGRTNKGEREINLFIKHVISKEHITAVDISELYSKELFFYKEVSKVFMELQNEARIPLDEIYKTVKVYNESNTETIIMKNAAKDGYATMYRMNIMPLKFAELSVQQLAKFHSLSFVLQLKRPQYYERKIKIIKQSIQFKDEYKYFSKKMYNHAVKELDSERKSKLDKLLPEYLETFPQYLSGVKTKVKCLCHGDYRMNNILMKLTEGEITEVIPVDYQLLYFGSPIIDFMFLIFGATDKDFRRNHINHLKDLYFDTLDNYLKYFDIDVNSVYTRIDFEKDYDECLHYGLQTVLFFSPLAFTIEEEVPDLNEKDFTDVTVKLNHIFYDRLKGVVDDMIEWGKL